MWEEFGEGLPSTTDAAHPARTPGRALFPGRLGRGLGALSKQVICTKLCLLLKKPPQPTLMWKGLVLPDFIANRQTRNTKAEVELGYLPPKDIFPSHWNPFVV